MALVVTAMTPAVRAEGDLSEAVRYAADRLGEDAMHGLEDLVDEDDDEALSIILSRIPPPDDDRDEVVVGDDLGLGVHLERDVLESLGHVRLTFTALRPFMAEAANETKLPLALIDAIVRTESGYRPHAVSQQGARGLMQLMPETARSMGVENAFDPRENILGGARYLKKLLERFGSIRLAVAAYNAGPAAVERHGGVPPFLETLRYVETVMRRYERGRTRM